MKRHVSVISNHLAVLRVSICVIASLSYVNLDTVEATMAICMEKCADHNPPNLRVPKVRLLFVQTTLESVSCPRAFRLACLYAADQCGYAVTALCADVTSGDRRRGRSNFLFQLTSQAARSYY